MVTGWKVDRHGIRACPLPVELPHGLRLLDGQEDEHWQDSTLPLVADLVHRVTPWASMWAAPAFSSPERAGDSGVAVEEMAVITSSLSPDEAVRVCLHELWHLAEVWTRPELLACLDRELSRGPNWPGTYLSSPEERRARAFAGWASFMVEGGRTVVAGQGVPVEAELFWHLFSGALGREVMARKAAALRAVQPSMARRLASTLIAGLSA